MCSANISTKTLRPRLRFREIGCKVMLAQTFQQKCSYTLAFSGCYTHNSSKVRYVRRKNGLKNQADRSVRKAGRRAPAGKLREGTVSFSAEQKHKKRNNIRIPLYYRKSDSKAVFLGRNSCEFRFLCVFFSRALDA